MRRLTLLVLAATVSLTAPLAMAQEWGDLKMRFVYDKSKPIPKQPPINPNKDIEFCGQHDLKDESLIVDPSTRGLKNVVLYAYTQGRGAKELPAINPELQGEPKTVTMANKDCRFDPRFVVLQAGDTLKVTNPDPIGHNYNFSALNNPAQNITIPSGGAKDIKIEEGEFAPVPVECNIHPWMRGYVVVFDHPYSAKSDEEGNLEIKGLPVAEGLKFRIFIEGLDGSVDDLKTAEGGKLEVSRNVIELDIKPGVNDLGDLEVPF